MVRNAVIVGAVALLGKCFAKPVELEARACAHDNLYRCFVDQRYSTYLSEFCSGLETFTSTIATVTATVTETASTTTVVASTQTVSFSLTSTVYTATVPSATVTVVNGAPIAKRTAASSLTLPACAATYPASRITSACACVNVPAATVSVTYTATTETVTSTPTLLVTSTTSETTFLSTTSVAVTSGVSTTTVICPSSIPNLIDNGGFDDASGWEFSSSDTSAWSLLLTSSTGYDGKTTNVAHVDQLAARGWGDLAYKWFNLQQGIRYKVGFMIKSTFSQATSYPTINLDVCLLETSSCSLSTPVSGGTLVGNTWAEFEYTFTAGATGASRLDFNATVHPANPDYYYDNVYLMVDC